MKIDCSFFRRVLLIVACNALLCVTTNSFSFSYEFYGWSRGAIEHEIALMDVEERETPLVLYFQQDSCELCDKMSNLYLANNEVVEFLMDFSKVEINPDRGKDEEGLAGKYGVERYPAFIISMPFFDNTLQQIYPFNEDQTITVSEFVGAILDNIIFRYNDYAYSCFENKNYENALKYFEMAREYDLERVYSYYALGIVWHTVGLKNNDPEQIKKAEENFVKALKIDPDHKDSKEALEMIRHSAE